MRYDIRLKIEYDYANPVTSGYHHLRVLPMTIPGEQTVVLSSLSVDPEPAERRDMTDFFGNALTMVAHRAPHDAFGITMTARVDVDRPNPAGPFPTFAELTREIGDTLTMDGASPQHFLGNSPRAPTHRTMTDYARESLGDDRDIFDIAMDLTKRIHADFTYDPDATAVDTPVLEAFGLRRGVCQDFSHVMIAALRGLRVPAGYVSGFLRTIVPEGQERLEGADAMHAWVNVWCGAKAGWIGFDPTNAMVAGNDHIVVAHGRDYSDATPVTGHLSTYGKQASRQAVDVIPLDDARATETTPLETEN